MSEENKQKKTADRPSKKAPRKPRFREAAVSFLGLKERINKNSIFLMNIWLQNRTSDSIMKYPLSLTADIFFSV